MKKKIFITLLSLVCAMVCAFSLAGCNLLDMFGESDYKYDAEKVEQSVAKMTEDGYKITLRYLLVSSETGGQPETSNNGFTIAAKGDLWYCKVFGDNETETVVDCRDNEEYIIYKKADGDVKWTKTTKRYNEMYDKETVKLTNIPNNIDTFTTYSQGVLDLGLKDKGKATIADRECTKYEAKIGGLGVSYSNEYYIDNETGLCLKNVMSLGAATAGSGTMSYECKGYTTPFDVSELVPSESDCVAPPADQTETPGE